MNKWNKKVTITLVMELDSEYFPSTKISGNMEDQVKDLIKDTCFNILGCGEFHFESYKMENVE